jgi:hypothetical protein
MDKLTLLTDPAVPHVVFGIFNLSWPSIAFWTLIIIFFAAATWLRIPEFMETDSASRMGGAD